MIRSREREREKEKVFEVQREWVAFCFFFHLVTLHNSLALLGNHTFDSQFEQRGFGKFAREIHKLEGPGEKEIREARRENILV